MAWTKPEFGRGQIDKAGSILAAEDTAELDWTAVDEAFRIVNNWRSSHSYPLHCLTVTLRNRARKQDPVALVAQRIKRIPAIAIKLLHNPNMQLSQMQDIGGCRAVMPTVQGAEKLVQAYETATAKNPKRAGAFVRKYDYIQNPKPSGYRGVHLVYKFCTKSPALRVYEGLRIEIQIRSQLQHGWATAVETVSTFTNQALKSNIGEVSWKRFFALMAGAIAHLEDRPVVPNTPENITDLRRELSAFSEQIGLLHGLHKATQSFEQATGDIFLLQLDPRGGTVQITSFFEKQMAEAQDAYLAAEKDIAAGKREMQAVLVSVDSFWQLSKAYPNYFLDISGFVDIINQVLDEPPQQ